MPEHTFTIHLHYEPTGDEMTVTLDWDTDDPDAIMDGAWPDGFADAIIDNISIIPASYDEH